MAGLSTKTVPHLVDAIHAAVTRVVWAIVAIVVSSNKMKNDKNREPSWFYALYFSDGYSYVSFWLRMVEPIKQRILIWILQCWMKILVLSFALLSNMFMFTDSIVGFIKRWFRFIAFKDIYLVPNGVETAMNKITRCVRIALYM